MLDGDEGRPAALAEHRDGGTEQDRDQEHLQDVALGERIQHRRRDDLHQEGDGAALDLADAIRVGGHRRGIERIGVDVHADTRLEGVGQRDADQEGEGRQDLEIEDRLDADPPHLLEVTGARDAEHHHAEDEWRNDHLDELDEAVAEGLQGDGKVGCRDPEDDPQDQRHEHLPEQRLE